MNEHSDPLDYILRCAEQGLVPKLFTVENAKDQLKKLRQELASYKIVAYGMTNDRYDLYNLRIQNNPHDDQTKIVPLYSNKEEFLNGEWRGYHYGKLPK
jgi:hypothetical protein